MNDQPKTIEERIADRTDLSIAGATSVSPTVGGIVFNDMGQVMEFSKLMAVAGQAVPKHLRGTPGACLAVSMQALNWRMDPFAVANKSYMVNDRIAYEAQLIHAVIEQRAPIKGRLKGRYEGEGAGRVCIITAVSSEDGDTVEYRSPQIGSITTKNSPLWKSDPDQQLWYYSARAMCRRHFPDVLLGVYEKEEIQNAEGIRDVTPRDGGKVAEKARLAREQAAQAKVEPVQQEDPDEIHEAEIVPDEEQAPIDYEQLDTEGAFPGSDHWSNGEVAREDDRPIASCPYTDLQKATDWCGGWREADRRAEG